MVCGAIEHGNAEFFGDGFEADEIGADDEGWRVGVSFEKCFDPSVFCGISGSDSGLFSFGGGCVFHQERIGNGDTDFDADGWGDPTDFFEIAPRDVVEFGADESEDIAFLAIFADEGGGEAEATV